MKLSNESRIEKLEKKNRTTKELSHRDKLQIDYRLIQLKFGFDVDGDGATEIMEWRNKLGKSGWDKLMKEFKEKERLATKAKQPTVGWERLGQQIRNQTL